MPRAWAADELLGDGEHATGAARRVVERLDDALGREGAAIGREDEVDHKADDFAGREVVAASSLLASLKRRMSSSKT